MLPRAVLTINMMCRHLFGFSATTRATGALAAFTGTAVAAGGIPTACAFTGSACAIGGPAVVLYSGNGVCSPVQRYSTQYNGTPTTELYGV